MFLQTTFTSSRLKSSCILFRGATGGKPPKLTSNSWPVGGDKISSCGHRAAFWRMGARERWVAKEEAEVDGPLVGAILGVLCATPGTLESGKLRKSSLGWVSVASVKKEGGTWRDKTTRTDKKTVRSTTNDDRTR